MLSAVFDVKELLIDPSAAEHISLDDQADLLTLACAPWFITNNYDARYLTPLLEGALRRSPASEKFRDYIRMDFAKCQEGLSTSAMTEWHERYQAGINLLRKFVDLVDVVEELVDSHSAVSASDTHSAGSARAPLAILDTVAKRLSEKWNSEPERWGDAFRLAVYLRQMPDPPHKSAAPSPAAPTPPKPSLFGGLFGGLFGKQ